MKRRYHARILFYLFIASLLPLLWLGTGLYKRSSSLIRSMEEERARHSLRQIASTLNLLIRNMDDTVQLLRMNNDFTAYEEFKDKDYFRNFHSHYNLERIQDYADFLDLRAGINRNLEQFAVTRPYIRSVYFLDPLEREVFSMDYIPSPVLLFPHREWYPGLHRMTDKTIMGPLKDRYGEPFLYRIYPEQLGSSMIFVVNISIQALYDFLWERVQPAKTEGFFVLDSRGKALLYDRGTGRMIASLFPVDESADSRKKTFRKVKIRNRQWLTGMYKDEFSGLSFYSIHDEREFLEPFNQNRRFILFILLSLLSINILLLVFLGKLLYSPISEMMGLVSNEQILNLEGLEHWISKAITEGEEREDLLKETVPAFQAWYLNLLLDGQSGENHNFQAPLPFKGNRLRLLLFFTDDKTCSQREILKILEDWCKSIEADAACFKREDNLAVILDSSRFSYKDLCVRVQSLEYSCFKERNIKLYGAVSAGCHPLFQLPQALEETEKALKDYLRFPFGSPVESLGLGSGKESSGLKLSSGFSDRVLKALKKGNLEEAETLLKKELEEIPRASGDLSFLEIQHFYIRIASALLSRLQDHGLDYYTRGQGGEDFFASLTACRTGEALNERLYTLLAEIATLSANNAEGHGLAGTYVSRAEQLMEKELGENISLASVAEKMNISPFYLSRLFREVRGRSFTEHLKLLRMEQAHKLLQNPVLKVKEVSRMVGYWSPNYFIKVFKAYYGVTPGEFRKTINTAAARNKQAGDSEP